MVYEICTADSKVGKLILVHQPAGLLSADLVYYRRWIRYARPLKQAKEVRSYWNFGTLLATVIIGIMTVMLGVVATVIGIMTAMLAIGCLAIVALVYRLFTGRRGELITFAQDGEPVAQLEALGRRNNFALNRYSETGDLEICLIFSALTVMDQVGRFDVPCELSPNGLE